MVKKLKFAFLEKSNLHNGLLGIETIKGLSSLDLWSFSLSEKFEIDGQSRQCWILKNPSIFLKVFILKRI